tara:strand:- start:7575 stop:8495 length:921 start_codon:yes stop_codon:yes gene_type:complete
MMKNLDKNCVVVGWNKISKKFLDINSNKLNKVKIIDIENEFKKDTDLEIISVKNISDIFLNKPRKIFYIFEKFDLKKAISLSRKCRENNCRLFFISNINSLDGKHYIDLKDFCLIYENNKSHSDIFIRLFDILFSLFVLIFIFPISIIVSFLILIEDGFPIIFSQERVGFNGKIFNMYKFRSMSADSEKYSKSPSLKFDKRITMIGKFIRMTSIDELPQFLNVIKGDMTIVGPRPEMNFIVNEYNDFEKLRLNIKPGITGPWQVSSARNLPIHYNVDYDIHHIINHSLRFNLKQIFKTIFLSSKGF